MISILFRVPQPIRFVFVLLYIVIIMVLSLLPPQDLPKIHPFYGFDKVVHMGIYLIFSPLFCWALKTEKNLNKLLVVIPVTVGWGIFMEYLQRGMHLGRSFELNDIIANSLGVVTGVLIYVIASIRK